MTRAKQEAPAARSVGVVLLHAALVAGACLTIAPLVWMVSASFMRAGEANTYPPPFFPKQATLEHYVALFTRLDLARHFANSVIVTVLATVGSLAVNSLAGFAFAKLIFPGRNKVFAALSSALVIPAQVGMLPLFLLLREMGLVNTMAGVVIPYLASVYGIFLVRQYALGIPDALLDAARVDGAGELRIFWSIVLPALRPLLVTLATFTVLIAWNDFMWPLIILTEGTKYTLPVALANLSGEHVQDVELMMAGAVITVLPALLVFLAFQRVYVRGILSGGLKG